jgi:hypothetical protein
MRRRLALASIAVAIAAPARAQTKPAVPLDPIAAITAVDLQTVENDVAGWPRPALAGTAGTSLGAARFGIYRALGVGDEIRMEEQFDAVLYLGPPSSITVRRGEIDPALCTDPDYMKMRSSRMALMELPGATPPPGIVSPSERLKRYCESVTAASRGCRATRAPR